MYRCKCLLYLNQNSLPCLFSCGDVIWNQCIKDRPCVSIETMKSNVAPRKIFSYSKCILSQVPWIKQSLQSEIRDANLYKAWWGGSEIIFFFLHITKLKHVDIHLWGTRTGCCPLWHSCIMLVSSTKNKARWEPAVDGRFVQWFFWSQTKMLCLNQHRQGLPLSPAAAFHC